MIKNSSRQISANFTASVVHGRSARNMDGKEKNCSQCRDKFGESPAVDITHNHSSNNCPNHDKKSPEKEKQKPEMKPICKSNKKPKATKVLTMAAKESNKKKSTQV
jgi:hypothetical protein